MTGIMVPLLKFYFHEDVRLAAVQSLPELLRSAVLAVEVGRTQDASLPAQLLDFVWQPLVDALHKVPAPAPARVPPPMGSWPPQLSDSGYASTAAGTLLSAASFRASKAALRVWASVV